MRVKYFFFILLFVIAVAAPSCKKDISTDNSGQGTSWQVPAEVTAAFQAKYPTATGQIEWEKENGNSYKVKFFIVDQRWQAIFNADGSFVSEKMI